MNITEALKSQKHFRRPHWSSWAESLINVNGGSAEGAWSAVYCVASAGFNRISLMPEDILAEDWEVEEPRVTITYSMLNTAVRKVVDMQRMEEGLFFRRSLMTSIDPVDATVNEVARQLGFNV